MATIIKMNIQLIFTGFEKDGISKLAEKPDIRVFYTACNFISLQSHIYINSVEFATKLESFQHIKILL